MSFMMFFLSFFDVNFQWYYELTLLAILSMFRTLKKEFFSAIFGNKTPKNNFSQKKFFQRLLKRRSDFCLYIFWRYTKRSWTEIAKTFCSKIIWSKTVRYATVWYGTVRYGTVWSILKILNDWKAKNLSF